MSVTSSETVAIGVGLDTARYGHHATFLREDRQPATEPLEFLECQAGYQELEKVLSKHPFPQVPPRSMGATDASNCKRLARAADEGLSR